MAIEQTAETGHDITLATHLVKNFDSYSEELKARVRDFVIESMAQPDGGARRFNIDRLGDYVEEETDLYLEVTVAPVEGTNRDYLEIKMDSRVVFDCYTPLDSISEYYSPEDPELELIIEEQLEQSVTGFNDIGECAMMELLHEMETGEEIQ
jgi:hypothetical protein